MRHLKHREAVGISRSACMVGRLSKDFRILFMWRHCDLIMAILVLGSCFLCERCYMTLELFWGNDLRQMIVYVHSSLWHCVFLGFGSLSTSGSNWCKMMEFSVKWMVRWCAYITDVHVSICRLKKWECVTFHMHCWFLDAPNLPSPVVHWSATICPQGAHALIHPLGSHRYISKGEPHVYSNRLRTSWHEEHAEKMLRQRKWIWTAGPSAIMHVIVRVGPFHSSSRNRLVCQRSEYICTFVLQAVCAEIWSCFNCISVHQELKYHCRVGN